MKQKLFFTQRKDKWWIEPTLTAAGFLCFVIYTTWRALSGIDFHYENYLSPFYSPLLFSSPLGEGFGHSKKGLFSLVYPCVSKHDLGTAMDRLSRFVLMKRQDES